MSLLVSVWEHSVKSVSFSLWEHSAKSLLVSFSGNIQ